MNKRIASLAFVGVFGLSLNPTTPPSINNRYQNKTEIRVNTSVNGNESSVRFEMGKEIKNNIKNKIQDIQNIKNMRATVSGKVTAVGTTNITVESVGTGVKVYITDKTHFRRNFWGESSLSEISVGDTVRIVGKWESDAKTEITAVIIRNLSIQKRFGVFFGTVKSISGDSFVMTTIHNKDEKVTIGSAKIINRKGENLNSSDIKMGNKVRVRGLWNNKNMTITEVTQIKNFSLP